MDIQPIWISSIKHLETFYTVATSTSVGRKLIGHYKMPKGFPKLNLYYFLGIPVVFFSKGKLSIEEKSLKYNASHNKIGFLKSYSNLKNDLAFEIEYSSIKSIERYQHQNAFINYYNINWIRITLNNDILDGDILICIGGSGPSMSGIINSNDKLFDMLEQNIRSVNPSS